MTQTQRKDENFAPDTKTRDKISRPSQFKLARIEKTLVPEGGNGRTWYRYVLDNGRSSITGQRCGSLKDVTSYANNYAKELNARALTGQSAWSTRTKKAAQSS